MEKTEDNVTRMKTEQAAHKRHREAMNGLDRLQARLYDMASGADDLGLDGLYSKLSKEASMVSVLREEATKAFHDEFEEHCKSIHQGTANMLGAVIAICDREKTR